MMVVVMVMMPMVMMVVPMMRRRFCLGGLCIGGDGRRRESQAHGDGDGGQSELLSHDSLPVDE
jgi:hypothetical protein